MSKTMLHPCQKGHLVFQNTTVNGMLSPEHFPSERIIGLDQELKEENFD